MYRLKTRPLSLSMADVVKRRVDKSPENREENKITVLQYVCSDKKERMSCFFSVIWVHPITITHINLLEMIYLEGYMAALREHIARRYRLQPSFRYTFN